MQQHTILNQICMYSIVWGGPFLARRLITSRECHTQAVVLQRLAGLLLSKPHNPVGMLPQPQLGRPELSLRLRITFFES